MLNLAKTPKEAIISFILGLVLIIFYTFGLIMYYGFGSSGVMDIILSYFAILMLIAFISVIFGLLTIGKEKYPGKIIFLIPAMILGIYLLLAILGMIGLGG